VTGSLDSAIKLRYPRIQILAVMALAGLSACGDSEISSEPVITQLPEVAAPGSAEPNLVVSTDGIVVMSWLEPSGEGVALRFATLSNDSWSIPTTVARGDNWFVNWADFPSVVPIDESLWAAHWLAKRAGSTYAYDIAVALSGNRGQSWGEPLTPHTDNTATEHGFVSLYPWQGGVGALWLDGRNMGEDGSHGEGSTGGGMTLRSTVIDPNLQLRNEQEADDLVCDCCQTDVTLGPDGPIAVYRNRTTDEIRDIYVMRSVNGQWQSGKPVAEDGWKIAGCPVNGPAIESRENKVAVAWFTGANNMTRVRFARSENSAQSFDQPIDIAEDRPIGRVGVALLENGDALVSWLRDSGDGAGEICVRGITANGILGKTHVIATTASGRMSGFPQMVVKQETAILAWTDTNAENTAVKSALLDASTLFQ
jgi:hypothetical protein